MALQNKSLLGIRIIAGVKLVKGVTLACLSLGVMDVIHKNLTSIALRFVEVARISPENRYVVLMLEKLGLVEPATLLRLGILSALYASILLIEGLGLWFGAAWAEYVVVISSGVFVPEECLALFHRFTWLKLGILVANAIMLVYVIGIVVSRYQSRRSAEVVQPA